MLKDRIGQRLAALRIETGVLLTLAVAAGLLLALAKIIEDVVEHESGAFDRAILLALRSPHDLARPIGPVWLEAAVKDITALGSPTVLTVFTVTALGYLLTARRYRLAAITAVSIIGGSIVEKTLKLIFDRARPDIVPHLVTVKSLSFPSGHAMLSTITYLTLGVLLAQAQPTRGLRVFVLCTGLLMALLIGSSRVYLGVH